MAGWVGCGRRMRGEAPSEECVFQRRFSRNPTVASTAPDQGGGRKNWSRGLLVGSTTARRYWIGEQAEVSKPT